MELFDKLGAFARNAADRTGDMVEVSRINRRIAGEQKKILEAMSRLGDHCWGLYAAGETLEEGAAAICAEIQAIQDGIDAMEKEIEAIRADQTPLTGEAPEPALCPSCGGACEAGDRFCQWCGKELTEAAAEPEAEAEPAPVLCPQCGVECQPGAAFCKACGARLA